VLLVEEAQNISKKEMLTILTRIGFNCKMIISGDLMQIDNFKRVEESGLYHAIEKLKDIPNIGIFEFSESDIVRNDIIRKILEKY
jgi:phosphate starvation-inducible PhoH-like protein